MDDTQRSIVYAAVLTDTAHTRRKVLEYWNDVGGNQTDSEENELDERMLQLRKEAMRSTSLALMTLDEADARADEVYKNSVAQELIEQAAMDDDEEDEDGEEEDA